MSTDSALLKIPPQGFTPVPLTPGAEDAQGTGHAPGTGDAPGTANAAAGVEAADAAAAAASNGEIRVYRGRSINELIPRIEAELGADAIVVRRRRGLEGGIAGFFQRPYIEVEAKPGTPRVDVYDEVSGEPAFPPAPRPAAATEPQSAPVIPWPQGAYTTHPLATFAAAHAPLAESPPAQGQNPLPLMQSPPPQAQTSAPEAVVEDPPRAHADLSLTSREPAELTSDTFASALLEAEHTLTVHVPEPPAPSTSLVPPLPSAATSLAQSASAPVGGRSRLNIAAGITGAGMSAELTDELIDSAIVHALPFAPPLSMAKAVQGALAARIPQLPLLPARNVTVAVIGPGGSGKTSCCAAMLAAYRRAGTLPARCGTVMLAGAHEEPAVLLSPQVMEPAALSSMRAKRELEQAREEGLLLLDLPPLSPADRSGIHLMAGVLGELRPDRVVLALPATLGAMAAAQLLEALRPLKATAMAITHADETDQIGVAIEAACRFGLAPEYLLDRGRVGGGLTRIDPTHLADRLLS